MHDAGYCTGPSPEELEELRKEMVRRHADDERERADDTQQPGRRTPSPIPPSPNPPPEVPNTPADSGRRSPSPSPVVRSKPKAGGRVRRISSSPEPDAARDGFAASQTDDDSDFADVPSKNPRTKAVRKENAPKGKKNGCQADASPFFFWCSSDKRSGTFYVPRRFRRRRRNNDEEEETD